VEDNGLSWHSYGKRYYDAVIGRFPNVDPLIDTFHFVTGYNYAENEPVANIDLWGLQKANPKNLATEVKEAARDFNRFSGFVEGGALATTAITGGAAAPIAVPVAVVADGYTKAAVVVEFIADIAEMDGVIDTETFVDAAVEVVSPIMSKRISDVILMPVIGNLSKTWDDAKKAVEAAANQVQNMIEDGVKSIVTPQPDSPKQ
jgi:RHS repeat-associated protein